MIRVNTQIPSERFKQFHEILCETGGRYLSNPRLSGDHIIVHYQPGDYEKEQHVYRMVTTPIVETNRAAWKLFIFRVKKFFH